MAASLAALAAASARVRSPARGELSTASEALSKLSIDDGALSLSASRRRADDVSTYGIDRRIVPLPADSDAGSFSATRLGGDMSTELPRMDDGLCIRAWSVPV